MTNVVVLAAEVLTAEALTEEALADVRVALAVEALARLALAKGALAECLMLQAELSAVSRVTVYLAMADGDWSLRCDDESCCCVVERVAAICVECVDEAASIASKCRGCCHGTVMSEWYDGTQWTVMVKLMIAMMIAIPRPWPDLRIATTLESAVVSRPARAGCGRAADDASIAIMELLSPKDRRPTLTHKSAHYPTSYCTGDSSSVFPHLWGRETRGAVWSVDMHRGHWGPDSGRPPLLKRGGSMRLIYAQRRTMDPMRRSSMWCSKPHTEWCKYVKQQRRSRILLYTPSCHLGGNCNSKQKLICEVRCELLACAADTNNVNGNSGHCSIECGESSCGESSCGSGCRETIREETGCASRFRESSCRETSRESSCCEPSCRLDCELSCERELPSCCSGQKGRSR